VPSPLPTPSSSELAERVHSVPRAGSIYVGGQKGFSWRGYMPTSCAGVLGVTVAAGQDGLKGGDGRGDGLHGETLTDLIHRQALDLFISIMLFIVQQTSEDTPSMPSLIASCILSASQDGIDTAQVDHGSIVGVTDSR
jgi:hypothetical protein